MIELIVLLLSIFLTLSLCLNFLLFYLFKKQKKSPQPTLTAEQLMHDLTAGTAVIRIHRIAPDSIFIRSPRDI